MTFEMFTKHVCDCTLFLQSNSNLDPSGSKLFLGFGLKVEQQKQKGGLGFLGFFLPCLFL